MFINKLENIGGFIEDNKGLFLCYRNNRLFLNDIFIKEDIDFTSLCCHNESLFFLSSKENKTYYFRENEIHEIDYASWLNTLNICDVLVYKYIAKKKRFNISVYNFLEKTVLKSFDVDFDIWDLIRFKESFCFFDSSKTTCFLFSINLSKYEWETDLSFNGQIKQILGVTDNTLWVWMSEHKLIGLNVNTGKVIHDFYPLQQLFDQGKSWANFPMFKEADKKLYFFEQDFFAAVNLEDQTTQVVWQEEGYHISLSVIHDDYIYFIGGKAQGFFKNGIGVFDRQKNEVVWQTEIELGDYVVLNQIQVGDDKIYVLDNEGTLRIYERED